MIYNLFYKSSATQKFTHSELDELLSRAREKNKNNGITGMLLYVEGSFVQLLEGDENNVKETFAVILKDKRHHNFEQIVETTSEIRHFPEWHMGFKWISKEDLKKIEKHENDDIRNNFTSSAPYKVIKLLSLNHWRM